MEIKLHYAAPLTLQPIRGFENGCHYFPTAKSALPDVDKPTINVPSCPHYHYFCIAAHIAPTHRYLCAVDSMDLLYYTTGTVHCKCKQYRLNRKYVSNNCIPVALPQQLYLMALQSVDYLSMEILCHHYAAGTEPCLQFSFTSIKISFNSSSANLRPAHEQ